MIEKLGYLTVIKLLGDNSPSSQIYVSLQLLNNLCENSEHYQDTFCMMGLIHKLHQFSTSQNSREILIEIAFFIGQLFQSSSTALKMFLSCDGIRILASFLSLFYEDNQDLIMLSIDSFTVFWKNLLIPVEDLTLILTEYEVP